MALNTPVGLSAHPRTTAAVLASLLTQIVCSRLFGIPLDLRSPLITGFSLSLLLRADEVWIHALAGVIAIASKFILRLDGKHIWNPAGLAIVVLLFATPGHVWISPGAWGSTVWFAALLAFFAILVLGASTESAGPGPLVSSLAVGATAGKFPIPITIVPGELKAEDIKALA